MKHPLFGVAFSFDQKQWTKASKQLKEIQTAYTKGTPNGGYRIHSNTAFCGAVVCVVSSDAQSSISCASTARSSSSGVGARHAQRVRKTHIAPCGEQECVCGYRPLPGCILFSSVGQLVVFAMARIRCRDPNWWAAGAAAPKLKTPKSWPPQKRKALVFA